MSDSDINPLYNKEGNSFTDLLIQHWERLQRESNSKSIIMDEKAMGFNESQLRRTGFAEAFTPELKAKMEQGMSSIQHEFKKNYDADQVTATLYLKKSANSDFYFLNKFDLQLQKDARTDSVSQTFYINSRKTAVEGETDGQQQKADNKYTLKEAYNLLAGRPVHKNLISKEGNEYEAWVKLNFKNKLDNGNFEMKQYTKNYGFELETVLAKYPIKELENPTYKQNLVDSLNRGNLQKATFVGADGKEEKLFISPAITVAALNIYDANKQRLSTDQLIEKQYIGKELGEKLRDRVGEQQEPEQRDSLSNLPSQKIDQKQKTVQRQKASDPVKKQSRKQKVK